MTAARVAAGQAGFRHQARAYWFLGQAHWSTNRVSDVLARLVAGSLRDPDDVVLVGVDDTAGSKARPRPR